jgi:hypothetical protein
VAATSVVAPRTAATMNHVLAPARRLFDLENTWTLLDYLGSSCLCLKIDRNGTVLEWRTALRVPVLGVSE